MLMSMEAVIVEQVKKRVITLYMPDDLLAALDHAATERKQSRAMTANTLLKDALIRAGFVV